MAMLVLLAAVMKADGKVVRAELDVVKTYLRQMFDEDTALEALQILKGLLQQDIHVESVAAQVGANLNPSAKLIIPGMNVHVVHTRNDEFTTVIN